MQMISMINTTARAVRATNVIAFSFFIFAQMNPPIAPLTSRAHSEKIPKFPVGSVDVFAIKAKIHDSRTTENNEIPRQIKNVMAVLLDENLFNLYISLPQKHVTVYNIN